MRPEPITIEFYDEKFVVRPLTLGQIRKLDKLLRDPALVSENLERSIQIIAIALERDHPEVAAKFMEGDFEAPMAPLGPVTQEILRIGGMLLETPVGES